MGDYVRLYNRFEVLRQDAESLFIPLERTDILTENKFYYLKTNDMRGEQKQFNKPEYNIHAGSIARAKVLNSQQNYRAEQILKQ
ncbi:hypothetical protein QUA56_13295 [Microcoleus sp. N3A4]|uniref:hypothetical protein n=1 Tax=Microcoleus sp. N3A4 TaxID=3055379 RepID=UPI002FD3F5DF